MTRAAIVAAVAVIAAATVGVLVPGYRRWDDERRVAASYTWAR